MNQAVVIICTRPESSRIPRKVFRNIAGLPAIEHILQRLTRANGKSFYPTILAVPSGCREYDHLPLKYDVEWYPGHPASPLHRMADAYRWFAKNKGPCSYIIRITHDDILIDPKTMCDLVESAAAVKAGYAVTPSIVDGAGVEVIEAKNLLWAADLHHDKEIEHISYFVKGQVPGIPNSLFHIGHVRHSISRPYRLTMDYEEDAQVLQAVLLAVDRGPTPGLDEVCHYIDTHQEIADHNRMPEVSFYTCVRNGQEFIERSMNSVMVNMGVRKSPSEYVVIDDASTDATLAKVIGAKHGDDRVKILTNAENLGLASSSNRAISVSRGKYIMRVDADDYLLPRAFSEMKQEMDVTGAAIVYANYDTVNEAGEVVDRNVPGSIHHHAGCALMNLKLLNEIRFREGLQHWDGLDLLKRVKAHFPVAYVEKPLWLYRVRQDSMSRTDPEKRSFIKRVLGL